MAKSQDDPTRKGAHFRLSERNRKLLTLVKAHTDQTKDDIANQALAFYFEKKHGSIASTVS